MTRLTLNKVNTHLKSIGINGELVKGSGYFYFSGDAFDFRDLESGVYCASRLNDLTLEQWVDEARARLKQEEQEPAIDPKWTARVLSHSRDWYSLKAVKFDSGKEAREFSESQPEFTCVEIYRPDGSFLCRNFPNPYDPAQRQAANAFDRGESHWRELMK